MKFRSDSHRKAVFANLFNNNTRKRSRVSSVNVKNFETKSKMGKTKLPKFKSEQVRFSDVKEVKGLKAHCDMCKRKGLSMKKGRCKVCSSETKKFQTQQQPSSIDFNDLKKSSKTLFDSLFFSVEHDLDFTEERIEDILRGGPIDERRQRNLNWDRENKEKLEKRLSFLRKHKRLLHSARFNTRLYKSRLMNFILLVDADRDYYPEVGWYLENAYSSLEVTQVIKETLGQNAGLNMDWRPNY